MTAALRHLVRDERGMTLVELMTSMAILGIVLAAFATVLGTSVTQGAQEQEITAIQTEARASVEQFARDLRQAYSGVDGTWPIEAISNTSIQFLSPQRLTPFKLQQIQWQLNGTNLQRRYVTTSDTDGDPWVWPNAITNATWDTRARSVRNTATAVFTGYEDDGTTVTTNPDDVRVVKVTLEVATTGQSARKFTFTTRITPRVTPT